MSAEQPPEKTSDARLSQIQWVQPPAPLAKLYSALVAAQKHASAVDKDSRNIFHGYKYASAEAIIGEARGALGHAGLAVFALGWDVTPAVLDPASTKDYQRWTAGEIVVRYRLVHESGESLDFQDMATAIIPEKGRPEDKAEATALTYNLGYFLRALLLLPREEQEVDARDDRKREPSRARIVDVPPRVVGPADVDPAAQLAAVKAQQAARAEPPHDPKTGEVMDRLPDPVKIAAALIEECAVGFPSKGEAQAWRAAKAAAANALPKDLKAKVRAAFDAARVGA